jgi:ATP-dependent Clp protease ATP-binding subunit ClpA
VLRNARLEARKVGHGYVGVEHILLGLLADAETVAAQALGALGVTTDQVRARVVEITPPGDHLFARPGTSRPLTPRARRVLELSLGEALACGSDAVGPEHILLGLARENESVAAIVLRELDASPEKIRSAVMKPVLERPVEQGVEERNRGPRFDDWASLNPSVEVRRLIMAAGARTAYCRRLEISLADVLVALTREEKTAAVLKSLGVEKAEMLDAIERHLSDQDPPGASGTE